MTPSASVVIPMHNGAEHIRAQLDALLDGLRAVPDAEIIVVDNRSTDNGPSIVADWAATTGAPVRVIPAHDKAGEPYARNVGWRAARSEHICYCDADDAVSSTWLQALSTTLRTARYATGPLDTQLLNDPRIADLRGQALFNARPALDNGTPFAHGCNMGFQRGTLEQLGGFDETYLIACDIEIGVRAAQASINLEWVPDALVNYRLRSSFSDIYKQARAYGRSRRRIDSLIHGRTGYIDWARQSRRAAWLLRHLPDNASYGGRMKWAWVAGQVSGELGGRGPWSK